MLRDNDLGLDLVRFLVRTCQDQVGWPRIVKKEMRVRRTWVLWLGVLRWAHDDPSLLTPVWASGLGEYVSADTRVTAREMWGACTR